MEYDIAIATLFMHHFSDEEITGLVSGIKKRSRIGVLVNDLHRSEMAYGLFWFISLFFGNHVARNDGLISIRKAFRREDLKKYAQQVKGKTILMDPNQVGLQFISLNFPEEAEAVVRLSFSDGNQAEWPVGLADLRR